jgi:cobalt-zinc-cadmium efflux system membrane fusion protein
MTGSMTPRTRRIACGLTLLLVAFTAGCGGTGGTRGGHEDGEEAGHADTHAERGPRGGRLFVAEGVQLELLIAEDGIPPEFRAYLYDGKGGAIEPVDGTLTVTLDRFGSRRDSIPFSIEGERFRGMRTVVEPHSFAARVVLERGGTRQEWTYEQEEGRIQLVSAAVERGEIETGVSGPRDIAVEVETPGEVRLNAERVVQVRPRFAGILRNLGVRLGDRVARGSRVATIQSNESMTDYEVPAPMAGTVVSRDVSDGQAVDHETILCTIADLNSVWVDFALYPQIAGRVRVGQTARVRSGSMAANEATGRVSYVGPLLEQDTRVSYGRIVLQNRASAWPPGQYVTVAVTVEQVRAQVAVPEAAIVRTSRGPGVFRADGTRFELQPVVTGRSDGTWTEIVEGLEAGAPIVIRNAFLLKAELGKSEATHDH